MLEEYILLNMEEDVNKAITDYLAVVFTYDICYKDNQDLKICISNDDELKEAYNDAIQHHKGVLHVII